MKVSKDLGIKVRNISEADKNYNYAGLIERKVKSILDNKNITENNKKRIVEFLQNCINESLSNARVSFYADKLKVISSILKKDFEKCDRKDLENLISEICDRYDKAETRRTYIITLKKLYRYLTGSDNPEIISWIKGKNYNKTAKRQNEKTKIENILTPEEVELIIQQANTPRDRALVGLIYYSAGRIGEIIGMRIKDVVFDDYKTIVGLNGKTGYRKVPVIECNMLLKDWLEYHPDKNNKEAYVWVSFNDVNRIKNLITSGKNKKQLEIPNINSSEHIGVRYVAKLLDSLGSLAGIDKKVNPHNFRHSRLTQLGKMGIDEDMLKLYAGHSKNSNVTSAYKHFSEEDLSDELDRLHGIKKDEESNEILKCFKCGHLNRNTLDSCENCGFSLNLVYANNLDKQQSKEVALKKVLSVMLEDELFKKVMARYIIDKDLVDYAKKLADDET